MAKRGKEHWLLPHGKAVEQEAGSPVRETREGLVLLCLLHKNWLRAALCQHWPRSWERNISVGAQGQLQSSVGGG